MSNAWVGDPGRISTTDEISAASGVEIVNPPPHAMLPGTLVMLGRVAATARLTPEPVTPLGRWPIAGK